MLQKKYMKQMGHENARMFFYVNSAEDLVTTLGGGVKVLADELYYKFIKRDGLKIITKIRSQTYIFLAGNSLSFLDNGYAISTVITVLIITPIMTLSTEIPNACQKALHFATIL